MSLMKKIMLGMLFLALLSGSAVFAQAASTSDISGTWQGTVKAGNAKLRLVLKISKAPDGSLSALFYSIDQGGQGIGATPTVQGSTVKISVPAVSGAYEGKLSADGKSIVGNWSQGPTPLPLILVRATNDTAWEIPAPPPRVKPMPADANPSFEVATIKPSRPDEQGRAFLMRGREFSTINTTLSNLITFAYGVHPRQIIGGPDWLDKDKYDLLGTPDVEGAPNSNQLKTMVQKLLADRFQLTFHHEKKELPVYAITIAKDGPKIAKSQGDPNGLPSLFFRGLGVLPVANATIGDLAALLQSAVLDRPVVDQTGLAGKYDFTLKWTPDEFQFTSMGIRVPPPADSASAPPDLSTAMQQQLGLRLEPTKATVDVIVIDRVQKPSAN